MAFLMNAWYVAAWAESDAASIPEFDFLSDPDFQNVKGYTLAEGHYELMTDKHHGPWPYRRGESIAASLR